MSRRLYVVDLRQTVSVPKMRSQRHNENGERDGDEKLASRFNRQTGLADQ